MTIIAKYSSICPCCNRRIQAGEKVMWERGSQATHVACVAGSSDDSTDSSTPPPNAPTASREITVERVGRRSYLRGDMLAVCGHLRAAGCHWDADSKAWWIGSHETALALIQSAQAAPAEAAPAEAAPAEAAPKKRHTYCLGCGCLLDTFQQ